MTLSNSSGPKAISEVFLENRDVFVFDLDNTLYPSENNLFAQVDVKIGEYVQKFLQLGPEDARAVQKRYLLEHGTTLKGLMANHTIDPQHYMDSVHDIDMSLLQKNTQLREALLNLDGRRIVFTNADTAYAERVLARIGIADLFEDIFDIHRAKLEPKPAPHIYDNFLSEFNIDPKRAIMFEDMARNLIPAHARGMATVWIDTDSVWGNADHHPSFIDAETTSLPSWLETYLDHKDANKAKS
ncbi:pyrimidine 5'-nucleotidase [Kordiimonas aquimaris]|uniref:pyrimidine 5'-nucleotidase n=1 Tax=Kordiimonas aquimaris TaxID=707591 RepID=UPI0021CF6392|nr:pyrimidine 5'-nucleotidase [Kordiimonas aquimaris]